MKLWLTFCTVSTLFILCFKYVFAIEALSAELVAAIAITWLLALAFSEKYL